MVKLETKILHRVYSLFQKHDHTETPSLVSLTRATNFVAGK